MVVKLRYKIVLFQSLIHSMPSTSASGKSASWHLVESIRALPRMRVRDNLPNELEWNHNMTAVGKSKKTVISQAQESNLNLFFHPTSFEIERLKV